MVIYNRFPFSLLRKREGRRLIISWCVASVSTSMIHSTHWYRFKTGNQFLNDTRRWFNAVTHPVDRCENDSLVARKIRNYRGYFENFAVSGAVKVTYPIENPRELRAVASIVKSIVKLFTLVMCFQRMKYADKTNTLGLKSPHKFCAEPRRINAKRHDYHLPIRHLCERG